MRAEQRAGGIPAGTGSASPRPGRAGVRAGGQARKKKGRSEKTPRELLGHGQESHARCSRPSWIRSGWCVEFALFFVIRYVNIGEAMLSSVLAF